MASTLTKLATCWRAREAPGNLRDRISPTEFQGPAEQETYSHIPFPGLQVIILVYSFLRKAAWDYGRLALLIHNDR